MQSIIWERRNLAIYCDTLFVTMLSWQVVELLVNCHRSWNPRRRKITYQHPTAFNRVPYWNLRQIWTWVTVFAIRKKIIQVGFIYSTNHAKETWQYFPSKKVNLGTSGVTTGYQRWQQQCLQFGQLKLISNSQQKITALKESHDFAFGVRSLSTHRIPLKLFSNSQQKNLQPWKNPMILLLGSGPFQHTAFPYFLVVMNIQGKNGYNNNNMSTTTRQQQHVNTTTTTTNNNNNNNNSGDRSNSRSHNLFFVSFDTAGLGCTTACRHLRPQATHNFKSSQCLRSEETHKLR